MDLVILRFNCVTLRSGVLNTSCLVNPQEVINQVVLRASCKGHAFRSKNQEIMNQGEYVQH